MLEDISKFKDQYKGEDIYVLGSGASLDYIDSSFFDNKISIGTNQTYRKFNTTFILRKEHSLVKEALETTQSKVIVARFNAGNSPEFNLNQPSNNRLYYFNHRRMGGNMKVDLEAFNTPNQLVASYSTITSSIHFAYHLGAKNIILAGVDHGVLDDKHTFEGYYKSIQETPWGDWNQYKNWLNQLEGDTRAIKRKLNELGVNVYSLNPFINFKLEGHAYKG